MIDNIPLELKEVSKVVTTSSRAMKVLAKYLKSGKLLGKFFVTLANGTFTTSLFVQANDLFLGSNWIDNSFEPIGTSCTIAISLLEVK